MLTKIFQKIHSLILSSRAAYNVKHNSQTEKSDYLKNPQEIVEITQLKRSSLNGAILRPLGFQYRGIEYTETGINTFSNKQRHIPFSDLNSPAKISKVFGFTAIFLPLKDGTIVKVAGLNPDEVTNFIEVVNEKFRKSVTEQFEEIEPEVRRLFEAVERLDSPQRYPAACLLSPFVARAKKIPQMLPSIIPEYALTTEQKTMLDTVLAFQDNPQKNRDVAIGKFIETELSRMQNFFDTIETHPLTPEQRLAVVTDEDATLVLAGAGSGKTSVIVAKAAYLLERGIRRPDEILLMAFGRDAAAEMADRIKERSGASVDALTFHALGNRIIREVEGRGAALADHASDDAKFRKLLRDILVNDVVKKHGLGSILLKWFSSFYWPYKSKWDFKSQKEYDEWLETHELRTFNGDRVKSFEELQIANWLYQNGIEFEYEPVYRHKLPADARGAYRPDFRLKDSGVYIEHFGVRQSRDSEGNIRLTTAPYINRERYLEDMEWKRKVHHENGTTLIETFSYEQVEGRLLESLEEKLAPYVVLKPVPEKQVFDKLLKMGQVDAFTQTIGTFLRHFKSYGYPIGKCQDWAENSEERPRAFLKIFEALFEAYQKRLGDLIDFEDMINRATAYVEAGRYKSPYRHLLVDEFQDISAGRARLLKAIKAQHADARIFAVGDDWQSIYRFAGADIHLMRDFGVEFGGQFENNQSVHSTVDLGRTFRSVDKIALPARQFILQNPSQIQKQVIPADQTDHPAIKVVYYDWGQETATLKSILAQLSLNSPKGASVLMLGRYNYLRPKNLKALSAEFSKLSLRFMTVHTSKGLEADHVIILRATSDKMGFPSEIVDDPLLNLVLPQPENFDRAEERRLFYVALTRARQSVTILTDRQTPSAFSRELVDNSEYETVTQQL